MNFPEFIRSRATWLDRLWCRLFGHDWGRWRFDPDADPEDKRQTHRACYRCGVTR